MMLSQIANIIPIAIDGDVTSSYDCDSFNMHGYDHATIIISHSASVVANNVLYVYGGATDGTKTAAATFTYRYGGAAAGSALADVLSAPATSAALTLTAATYQGRVLVLEIDAEDLNISGTQYDWVTVNFDGTASTGTVSAFAILSQARYARNIMPTAIPAS